MNERIKELLLKAGGNPNYKAFRGHFLPPPPDYIDPATVDLEKFAELIVKECAGVCDDERDSTDSEFGKLVAEGCALKIMERFGVEE